MNVGISENLGAFFGSNPSELDMVISKNHPMGYGCYDWQRDKGSQQEDYHKVDKTHRNPGLQYQYTHFGHVYELCDRNTDNDKSCDPTFNAFCQNGGQEHLGAYKFDLTVTNESGTFRPLSEFLPSFASV